MSSCSRISFRITLNMESLPSYKKLTTCIAFKIKIKEILTSCLSYLVKCLSPLHTMTWPVGKTLLETLQSLRTSIGLLSYLKNA